MARITRSARRYRSQLGDTRRAIRVARYDAATTAAASLPRLLLVGWEMLAFVGATVFGLAGHID